MTAEKPSSQEPASNKPQKPTGIELTEEDLKRVSGGMKKEETSEKKGG